jgi:hypothetical protein
MNHPGEVYSRDDLRPTGFSPLEQLAARWSRFDAAAMGIKLNGEPSPEQAAARLEATAPLLREARALLGALDKMRDETLKRIETLGAIRMQADRVINVAIPVGRDAEEKFKALVKTLHPLQLDALLKRVQRMKGAETDGI